jgi:hypothetical protein
VHPSGVRPQRLNEDRDVNFNDHRETHTGVEVDGSATRSNSLTEGR